MEDGKSYRITFPDFPGGPGTFEAAAKFCYGVRVELTPWNVAPLRCAAEYLEMTEEHSEELEERRCRRECVREIPPKPFQSGPPLNSTALLRLNSTEPNRRETPSSIIFEGHQIVLCLVVIYLKSSIHTISPQRHCHQSPKLLRDKNALTISPFLVD